MARVASAHVRVEAAPGAEGHIGDALEEFLLELGLDIQGHAERIVPVDTFALQESLDTEVERTAPGAAAVRVGSNLDYALTVEKGRRDMPNYPVQPYLAPALYQVRGR